MKIAIRIAVAACLVLSGWAFAKAQPSQPDFEIVVTSPGGETTVECRRGCKLKWFERGPNPNAATMRTFQFRCTADRCGSGAIGGWLEP